MSKVAPTWFETVWSHGVGGIELLNHFLDELKSKLKTV
jgi:hypothetical protein